MKVTIVIEDRENNAVNINTDFGDDGLTDQTKSGAAAVAIKFLESLKKDPDVTRFDLKSEPVAKEKFTFFWDGPFSQWHRCNFVIDGVTYNCAEQYMMAEKARLFGDTASLELIMTSDSPREQKNIGRNVANFDKEKWNEVAYDVVYRGNRAKFSQNGVLYTELLNTAGTLVEASPYDTVWGIGLAEDDPLALDRSTWKGQNWLGQVLTTLRNDLLNEEKN